MKPQCVHDVFRFAKPFHRVNVHKTGQKVNAVGLECVKRVVLAIVPPDDHEVIAAVEAWPAEVDFESRLVASVTFLPSPTSTTTMRVGSNTRC